MAYIYWAGLGGRVWGAPSWRAFAQWGRFAALAYPAALMRCMESFCYSGMTVVAGAPPPRLPSSHATSHRHPLAPEPQPPTAAGPAGNWYRAGFPA